jgi:hypothetical protein
MESMQQAAAAKETEAAPAMIASQPAAPATPKKT